MSVTFQAPYGSPVVQILLPNPEFGDHTAAVNEVTLATSMNNTPRTYIKTKDGRVKKNRSFRLTRAKAIELFEFYKAHAKDQIRYVDRDGQGWRGYFSIDPIDMESIAPLFGDTEAGDALVRVTIEMDLYKL
jgi:hypothetical protein